MIEARNRDNDFFALPEAMEAMHDRTPREFLDQMRQGLICHTQGCLADDVAMILVDRLDEEVDEDVGAAAVVSGGMERDTARAAVRADAEAHERDGTLPAGFAAPSPAVPKP
ncbi:SpoIIE family protein phosphatase [Streptomyces sp. A3M-1-3]|uniref:SpoIIE family protein phosphatase n=1 Tax=Streptomyces sp. A3M-1-3 TaxID=2962044 RepID=UPI0020B69731|nr:SpoIIE family protein phosphatase [Streptomyces sp. A3M-1-3]